MSWFDGLFSLSCIFLSFFLPSLHFFHSFSFQLLSTDQLIDMFSHIYFYVMPTELHGLQGRSFFLRLFQASMMVPRKSLHSRQSALRAREQTNTAVRPCPRSSCPWTPPWRRSVHWVMCWQHCRFHTPGKNHDGDAYFWKTSLSMYSFITFRVHSLLKR